MPSSTKPTPQKGKAPPPGATAALRAPLHRAVKKPSAAPVQKAPRAFNAAMRAQEGGQVNYVAGDKRMERLAQKGAAGAQYQAHSPGSVNGATPPGKVRGLGESGRVQTFVTPHGQRTPSQLAPAGARKPTTSPARAPGNELVITWNITKDTRPGTRVPSQAAAMGGWPAKHYAEEVKYPSHRFTRWEWLHLVARRLGGKNEKGNLVAGAYDCNTRMIPFEDAIDIAKRDLQGGEKIVYTVKAQLWEGTYVARLITLHAEFPARLGLRPLHATLDALSSRRVAQVEVALLQARARSPRGALYNEAGSSPLKVRPYATPPQWQGKK